MIDNTSFNITEVEIYCQDKTHQDPYIQQHLDQKTWMSWYFHRYSNDTYKTGTNKGLQFTLGTTHEYDDRSFGVLIRSIANDKSVISEPHNVVDFILKQLKKSSIPDLTKGNVLNAMDGVLKLVPFEAVNSTLYCGTRIGLNEKKSSEYYNKPYRFVCPYPVVPVDKSLSPCRDITIPSFCSSSPSSLVDLNFIDTCYDDMTLTEFISYAPNGWKTFFSLPDVKACIDTASKEIQSNKTHNIKVFPSISNMFRIFFSVPLDKIKVVILGQDPYHTNNGAANGVAFSVSPTIRQLNPSLRNIMDEVKKCGFEMTSSDLDSWTRQGVFLCNTSLSVKEGLPNSHSKFWSPFTCMWMNYVLENSKDVVFLLFGRDAQIFEPSIRNHTIRGHTIVKTSHPSPLSAYKASTFVPAFFGSKCFTVVNSLLEEKHLSPIDWRT
jgi:uracil-DNA glycosylase